MKPAKITGLILLLLGLAGLYLLRDASPLIRLSAASLGMIWIIKCAALLWQLADGLKPKSALGLLAFLFAWPGVSFAGFQNRGAEPPASTGNRFLESWLCFVFGFLLLLAVSLYARGESTALNYAALLCILLIVHLGLVEVIADGLRLLGFSPVSLFDRPFLARSLRDFWSVRWNRAFVDMNKIFLLQPLRNILPPALLVFSIFAVSGLLHELGISYADGISWGFPLLYFVIQGIGMELEKHWKLPRAILWAWIILPMPLLFTKAFVNLFLGGLAKGIAGFLFGFSAEQLLWFLLVAGGCAHFLVLGASVQVPGKLGWKLEFQKLLPLNRKVFWTYGAYILCIIVLMGIVSLVLAGDMPNLHVAASRMWLGFIALFWWARVLTDFFYMSHEDWPQGPLFTVGHTCLSTLFLSLAILYTTILVVA